MVFQDLIAPDHHLPEHRIFGQIFPDPFRQDIMGRRQVCYLPIFLDQKVPVTGPHIKSIALSSEPFPERFHKGSRLFRRDLSGAVVQDHPVLIPVFLFGKSDTCDLCFYY